MGATTTGQSPFRDAAVLTDGHTPETPIGRDDSVAQLQAAVRPVARRKPPANVLLVGPPGTGKTTVVSHVLDAVEHDTRVKTAMINCWQYRTRPAVLAELLIQLGYPAPRKGTPVDERLTTVQELLAKSDGFLVALDEFDQCTDQTEVVYDLQAATAETANELGLILVSTQPLTALDIDARSHSRLDCRTIALAPYTADDLAAILHRRADQAFHRTGVSPAAIDRIAVTVADDGGDCRQALSLLLRAGRTAEREGTTEVTVDHVEASLTARQTEKVQ